MVVLMAILLRTVGLVDPAHAFSFRFGYVAVAAVAAVAVALVLALLFNLEAASAVTQRGSAKKRLRSVRLRQCCLSGSDRRRGNQDGGGGGNREDVYISS